MKSLYSNTSTFPSTWRLRVTIAWHTLIGDHLPVPFPFGAILELCNLEEELSLRHLDESFVLHLLFIPLIRHPSTRHPANKSFVRIKRETRNTIHASRKKDSTDAFPIYGLMKRWVDWAPSKWLYSRPLKSLTTEYCCLYGSWSWTFAIDCTFGSILYELIVHK
mgnify:CR=1 FL=1